MDKMLAQYEVVELFTNWLMRHPGEEIKPLIEAGLQKYIEAILVHCQGDKEKTKQMLQDCFITAYDQYLNYVNYFEGRYGSTKTNEEA